MSVRTRQASGVDGDAEMRCKTRRSVRSQSSVTSSTITITIDVEAGRRAAIIRTVWPDNTLFSCHASVYSKTKLTAAHLNNFDLLHETLQQRLTDIHYGPRDASLRRASFLPTPPY